jgi:hypothetical protein
VLFHPYIYKYIQAINSHIEVVRKGLAGSNTVVRDDGSTIPAKRIVSDNTLEYILYQTEEATPAGITYICIYIFEYIYILSICILHDISHF